MKDTEFSRYTRALRRTLAMNQTEFAVRVGVSIATVQNWEQGRTKAGRMGMMLIRAVERSLSGKVYGRTQLR